MNRALERALCFLLFAAISASPVAAAETGARKSATPRPKRATSVNRQNAAPAAPAPGHAPAPAVSPNDAGRLPSMILALDPVTGDRVAPTTDQALDLHRGFEALFDSSAPTIEVRLPDGSRGSYVARRLATALYAYIGPSGHVVWGCGPGSAPAGPIGLLPLGRLPIRPSSRGVPATVPVVAPEE